MLKRSFPALKYGLRLKLSNMPHVIVEVMQSQCNSHTGTSVFSRCGDMCVKQVVIYSALCASLAIFYICTSLASVLQLRTEVIVESVDKILISIADYYVLCFA